MLFFSSAGVFFFSKSAFWKNSFRNTIRVSDSFGLFVLFDLIIYVPSTFFLFCRDKSSWVEPVLS